MRKRGSARHIEALVVEMMSVEGEISTLREQLATWADMRDDLKTRAVVSETPQATAEYTDIERQVGIVAKEIDRASERLASLRYEFDAVTQSWNPEEDL